jgi:S-DNA-T family DNA segregation ATPase FtsK/SpoIIIE
MKSPSSSLLARFETLLAGRPIWRIAAGAALVLVGIITLMSILNVNRGGLAAPWSDLLRHGFGTVGTVILCIVMAGAGLPVLLNSLPQMDAGRWIQLIALEVAFFAFLALLHSIAFEQEPYALVRNGEGGGAIGWVLAEAMWKALRVDTAASVISAGRVLAALLWFLIFVLAAIYAARPLLRASAPAKPVGTAVRGETRARNVARATDSRPIRGTQLPLPDKAEEASKAKPKAEPIAKAKKEPGPATVPAPAAPIKSNAKIIKADTLTEKKPYVQRPDTLPPLDLLKRIKDAKNSNADVKRQADMIEQTLVHFGLVGKVTEIRQGPTVTQFGIEPGYIERPGVNGEKRQQKIRVGQIASLQSDFALALAAPSIRIEAPIPGRSLVGIEVPNANIGTVDLRSLLESDAFRSLAEKSPLAIGLGKDVSGTPICADLSRMPHLLIAGTTGSGKSICIIAITLALVLNNRPEDLKLVLIDPKMVELSRFTGLPHIIGKPEHESDRLPAVLKWVVNEMERRYKSFAQTGSRNLQEYNESMKRQQEEPLPRIVVMIDELADMMMQAPIETEKQICRLAQMARATGIHMIVATQRPSVDVVTGLIKANFPARISFAVASGADSRVILDQTGAESLLGRGDMLFMNPETGQPQRIQGAWVSDRDLEQVLKWWRNTTESEKEARGEKDKPVVEEAYVANKKPEFDTPWEREVAQLAAERNSGSSGKGGAGSMGGDESGGDDDLIQKAMEIIRTQGNVSTSLLQRKLRIGYPRAARLMEDLQEMGYVGAKSNLPTKGREVKQPTESEE